MRGAHFLEILKRSPLGIASALKTGIPRRVLRIAIKQTIEKQKAISMLNKLNKRRGGFTLVEIMIVVAIIACWQRSRCPDSSVPVNVPKPAVSSTICAMIDSAVDQYAIETNRSTSCRGCRRGLDELPEEGLDALQHRQESPRQYLRCSDRRHHPTGACLGPSSVCPTSPAPVSGRLTDRKNLTIHSPVIRPPSGRE